MIFDPRCSTDVMSALESEPAVSLWGECLECVKQIVKYLTTKKPPRSRWDAHGPSHEALGPLLCMGIQLWHFLPFLGLCWKPKHITNVFLLGYGPQNSGLPNKWAARPFPVPIPQATGPSTERTILMMDKGWMWKCVPSQHHHALEDTLYGGKHGVWGLKTSGKPAQGELRAARMLQFPSPRHL